MQPHSDATRHVFKLLSKEILARNITESILSTEETAMKAYVRFVEDHLTGSENLWAKLT